jgi:hypothetical protein
MVDDIVPTRSGEMGFRKRSLVKSGDDRTL